MSFQFKSLREYHLTRQDQVFRWSVGRTVLPTIIFSGLFLAGVWQIVGPEPALADVPVFVRGISTLGFLLIALVAWAQTKAGLGPGSLVAVVGTRNLWVKYRSPLNAHIGQDRDTQVVGIPLQDLIWCQQRSVKTIRRAANNRNSSRTVDSLDLGLVPNCDVSALKERLEAERAIKKKASHSHQHFPLRLLEDGRIRIDLYNVPGGSAALESALPSSLERRESALEVIDDG